MPSATTTREDPCKYRTGDYLQKTVDLVTSYGRVVLFNSDKKQLIADAQ
jgi:L-amino acid ligase